MRFMVCLFSSKLSGGHDENAKWPEKDDQAEIDPGFPPARDPVEVDASPAHDEGAGQPSEKDVVHGAILHAILATLTATQLRTLRHQVSRL
jgi:hypothetical protein